MHDFTHISYYSPPDDRYRDPSDPNGIYLLRNPTPLEGGGYESGDWCNLTTGFRHTDRECKFNPPRNIVLPAERKFNGRLVRATHVMVPVTKQATSAAYVIYGGRRNRAANEIVGETWSCFQHDGLTYECKAIHDEPFKLEGYRVLELPKLGKPKAQVQVEVDTSISLSAALLVHAGALSANAEALTKYADAILKREAGVQKRSDRYHQRGGWR